MPGIEHVVVLMLENRSFDHLLGYLTHPDPGFDGLTGNGPFTNPVGPGGLRVAASPHAKTVLPAGPDHSHDAVMEQLALDGDGQPTNQGFVISYERKASGLAPPAYTGLLGPLVNWVIARAAPGGACGAGRGPLVMLCHPPEHVPALSTLAREFAVCTRWFCSVPGETWPNRNFAHAATSDGETAIAPRPYTNRTIFEVLEEHGADWRIYHDDIPQAWAFPALWESPERHAKWFPMAAFAGHAAAGDLPAYTFIEPNYRPPVHTLDHTPIIGAPGHSNSQHPENNLVSDEVYDDFSPPADTDFSRADRLIASVYEALRGNRALFDRTALLVTYDEHGGLYDHVPPPTGVPSPGGRRTGVGRAAGRLLSRKAASFDFTMLGPRVPAVVISPRVPAATIDARVHDHASIPATLRALFAPKAPPLTRRDAWSASFHDLLTLPEPRTDLPDLSEFARAPEDEGTVDGTPSAAGAAAAKPGELATAGRQMPAYYRGFLGLADEVQGHLAARGEPEALTEPASGEPLERSSLVSRAFAAAADRHRRSAARRAG